MFLSFSAIFGAHTAYAQVATSTATSTPHQGGSNMPLYFFKTIGINTTLEAADAAWRDHAIRDAVMRIWRHVIFGYDLNAQI